MLIKKIKGFGSEVYCGICNNISKFIIFSIYILIITLGNYWKLNSTNPSTGFFGNLLNGSLKGIPFVNFFQFLDMQFPAGWIMTLEFALFVTGDYIYDDIRNMGVIKVSLGGRKKWWNYKFIWALAEIFIYCFIFYVVQFVTMFVINKKNIPVHMDSAIYKSDLYRFSLSEKDTIIYSIIVPILCFTTIILGNIVLGMIISTNFSFVLCTIYIAMGIFINSSFFISNQLMMYRAAVVTNKGWQAGTCIWIDVILIIAFYFIGRSYVQNKDFI